MNQNDRIVIRRSDYPDKNGIVFTMESIRTMAEQLNAKSLSQGSDTKFFVDEVKKELWTVGVPSSYLGPTEQISDDNYPHHQRD